MEVKRKNKRLRGLTISFRQIGREHTAYDGFRGLKKFACLP